MSKYITGKNLLIHKSCENLIEQCQGYAWDPKYQEKGEDKPIKKNDHAVDSCRYLIATAFKNGLHQNPYENISYDQLRRQVFGYDEGWGAMIHGGMGGF